ncbi:cellulase family glycosylhydrolase [Mumia qirimensis]|uniref:cellulase family glycosylhydrolase n=1 Tax=Mumia qirimensis TaxID=3234852 RepID=UPI00351D5228
MTDPFSSHQSTSPKNRTPRRGGDHRGPRRRRSTIAAAGAASLVAGFVVLTTSTPASGEWIPGPELVVNGSFEDGTTGWKTNGGRETPLVQARPGVDSANSALISASARRNLVLNDAKNTVRDTDAETRFRVSALVRSDNVTSGELRVREVTQKVVTLNRERFRLEAGADWQRVSLELTVERNGSSLDLNVITWDARPGENLYVEDVSMVQMIQEGTNPPPTEPTTEPTPEPTPTTDPTTAPTPSPEPTPTAEPTTPTDPEGTPPTPTPTTAPTTPPPTTEPPKPEPGGGVLTNGCKYSARGIPECGAYFGAALGSNDDPTPLEKKAGQRFGIHRTFWQASQVDAAVRTAEQDLALGRLPWISFKLPTSWEAMASGAGDAWARDIADRLGGLDGPVWVAFHHEPETDGDMAQWTQIQRRLAPIVRSTAPNVAYTIILTGWHQVEGQGDTASYGLDRIWPTGTKIDVVGFDVYNRFGTDRSNRDAPYDLGKEFFEPLAKWSKANGIPWAIGETGYTDATAKADSDWLQKTYDQLVDLDGIAMSYFSSSLNATGDWLLDTSDRQDQFVDVLRGTPLLPVS